MNSRHFHVFAAPGLSTIIALVCFLTAAAEETQIQAAKAKPGGESSAKFHENFQIHAGWQPLFNGRDLEGWYTFLQQ